MASEVFKPNPNRIVDVPLKQIHVPYTWNARTLKGVDAASIAKLTEDKELSSGADDNTGVPGLIVSLQSKGQDTPVTLRLNPDEKTARQYPYSLVCGFKRMSALLAMAELPEDHKFGGAPYNAASDWRKAPTVRAYIEDLSDLGAIALNARENLARQSLTPPDLVFAVTRLARGIGGTDGLTQQAIAGQANVAQGHVSMLLRIGTKVKPSILADWRNKNGGLSLKQMLNIAGTSEDRQSEEYENAVKALAAKEKPEKGAAKWLPGVKERAQKYGVMFGRVHTAEGIDAKKLARNPGKYIRMLVDFKADCTDKQFTDICDAFAKGFDEGLTFDAEKAKADEEKAQKAAEKAAEKEAKAEAKAKANSQKEANA